jgi:hypothetical protein
MLRVATRTASRFYTRPAAFASTTLRHYTMPALQPDVDYDAFDAVSKPLPMTTTTKGLQEIADKHITKGVGRLRDHIFKEGKGLWVLTTVCRLPRFNRRIGANDLGRKARLCWTLPLALESHPLVMPIPMSRKPLSHKRNRSFTSNAPSAFPSHMFSWWNLCCR